jgi:tetratricopeptide (TPR) repeat protein
MPSKPLPISPAIAQLLRDRRQSLGLTLRRVEELTAESGDAIPHSTLARIELGRFDPGVRRLRQLLDLYQLPIQAAGDVLDLEALAAPTPFERDPAKLRDRALDAWRKGNVAEALSCFLAFRRRVPNDDEHRTMRQEAILAFAVASASLGRLHLSRHMLDELLLENPEPRILVPILIEQSVIWRSLGAPVPAAAFLDSAAKHASPERPKQLGWIEHQRAHRLIDERRFAEAAKCLTRARQYYRRAKSTHDEALALQAVTRVKFEQGRARDALKAARASERFAVKHEFNRVRLSAMVDQARAQCALGSIDIGKRLLRTVLADPMAANDNVLLFYTHFYSWRAERDSGNLGRAEIELRESSHYLKYVDQNYPESKVVRQELGGQPTGREAAESTDKRSAPRKARAPRAPRRSSKQKKS